MKILVTGANGFIGEAVCLTLEESGLEIIKIYGMKMFSEINHMNLSDDEKKEFAIDLSDENSLNELEKLQGITTIIHCAGLAHQTGKVGKNEFFNINVKALNHTLEFAKEKSIQKFVLISSVSVYGAQNTFQTKKPIDEEAECHPREFYAESKLEGEKLAAEFCVRNNIKLIIFRPSTVIGEGDPGNLLQLIKLLNSGKFFWIGRGENKKSLIYKNDIGRAVLRVLQFKNLTDVEKNPLIYNLTSEPVKMCEIVKTIEQTLQLKFSKIAIPVGLPKFFLRLNDLTLKLKFLENISVKLEKWLSDDVFSGEKFKKDYAFSIEKEALEAIKSECQWYLNQSL